MAGLHALPMIYPTFGAPVDYADADRQRKRRDELDQRLMGSSADDELAHVAVGALIISAAMSSGSFSEPSESCVSSASDNCASPGDVSGGD